MREQAVWMIEHGRVSAVALCVKPYWESNVLMLIVDLFHQMPISRVVGCLCWAMGVIRIAGAAVAMVCGFVLM